MHSSSEHLDGQIVENITAKMVERAYLNWMCKFGTLKTISRYDWNNSKVYPTCSPSLGSKRYSESLEKSILKTVFRIEQTQKINWDFSCFKFENFALPALLPLAAQGITNLYHLIRTESHCFCCAQILLPLSILPCQVENRRNLHFSKLYRTLLEPADEIKNNFIIILRHLGRGPRCHLIDT